MGIEITYRRLFTVRVKEQGTNNTIRSWVFSPISTCESLLHRYQLFFKAQDDGFEIYYKSYPLASTPIPAKIEDRVRFTFGIRITDPSFLGKYEPNTDVIPQFYLDNLTASGAISTGKNLTDSAKLDTADLAHIKQQTFTLKTELPIGNEPSEWRLKEKFGTNAVIQTFPIDVPTDPAVPYIYVPMNDPIKHPGKYIAAEGPYLLETNKPTPATATVYLNNAVKQSAFNGVLDVYWNSVQSSAPADTGKEYQIVVKPK